MRDALLADFAAIAGVEVVTTCDPRVPLSSALVTVHEAQHPGSEWSLFERLCRECDAVYVLAPELDGELLRRCRLADSLNRRPLNCTPAAVELCGDKLALSDHLLKRGVPTIPAALRSDEIELPLVIKRRDGAGSQEIRLCRTRDELQSTPARDHFICQPYVAGRTLSVAAFVDAATGEPTDILPVAEQHLSDDGEFRYLGGAIPARRLPEFPELDQNIRMLIRETCRAVPGLRGYVGFDLIAPDTEPAGPVLVEINPRLTTSYVGYRRLTPGNLAGKLLDGSIELPFDDPLAARVEFTADGTVTWQPPEPRRSSAAPQSRGSIRRT